MKWNSERWSTRAECSTLGILLAFLLLLASARAAGPLTAEIKPVALRPRAFAPEALDVKLTWTGTGLLEGALELSFPSVDENAPRFRSHDLAMTGGVKDFRIMIPPAMAGSAGFSREILARFVTKSAVLDLGRFDFGAPQGSQRTFSICVCRPKLIRPAGEFSLWQSLRIERFQPSGGDFRYAGASTLPVHVEPDEMPASALAYTPYDIVLLEGAALAEMREKQVAALSRWVLAGGSLCLIASAPLDMRHRDFLTSLLSADPRAPQLAFEPNGHVSINAEGRMLLARPGFGRLIVTAAGPQSEADADAWPWKRAAMFLWKMREAQMKDVLAKGTWDVIEKEQESWRRNNERQQLASALAPKDVRILPTSAMLLLLAGFVVIIGPVDWLVLGRFRLRRLTWIFFPIVAVVFTALTVWLASYFLGTSNYRSMLTLTDLGHDGRVLRETRFEMIFPSKNQVVTTDVRNALYAPVSVMGNYGDRMPPTPGVCEGLFPASYTVRQSLRQWTPQLNRTTSLEGGTDDSGLDWADLHPSGLTAEVVRARIGKEPASELYTLHQGKFTAFNDSVRPRELVRFLTQPTPLGWLSVFSHVSPNGAAWNGTGDFEDLALASSDDAEVSATIVLRKQGQNIHIYRHLYAP